jgi:hypothetical protein
MLIISHLNILPLIGLRMEYGIDLLRSIHLWRAYQPLSKGHGGVLGVGMIEMIHIGIGDFQ